MSCGGDKGGDVISDLRGRVSLPEGNNTKKRRRERIFSFAGGKGPSDSIKQRKKDVTTSLNKKRGP